MFKRTLPALLLMLGLPFTQAVAGDQTHSTEDVIHMIKAINESAVQPVLIDATYLGITAAPVTQAMNSQLNLPKGLGLLVTHVAADSPAENAGLLKHDVLHKLDDQLLANFEQFSTLIRLHEPGDTVTLSLIRGGEPTTLKATLGEHRVPEHTLTLHGHPGTWIPKPNTPPHGIWLAPPSRVELDSLNAELRRAQATHDMIFPQGFTAHPQDRYKLRILDGDYKINIRKLTDEGPHITVEDAQANILHDGPWDPDTDPEASGLPDKIVQQIHNVLNAPHFGQPIRITADEIQITAPPQAPEQESP